MDELDEPIDDWELMDEVEKAQLQLLYALQTEVGELSRAVKELMEITKAPRETKMTGRDGKVLTATSVVKRT